MSDSTPLPTAPPRAPSDPNTGAARDLARTVAGLVIGAVLGFAADYGVELTPESQVAVTLGLAAMISAWLARAGKLARNVGGWLGTLFLVAVVIVVGVGCQSHNAAAYRQTASAAAELGTAGPGWCPMHDDAARALRAGPDRALLVPPFAGPRLADVANEHEIAGQVCRLATAAPLSPDADERYRAAWLRIFRAGLDSLPAPSPPSAPPSPWEGPGNE